VSEMTVILQPQVVTVIEAGQQGPPGPPGPSGGAASLVVGETPAGAVNGSNATFTSAYAFIPESVEVMVNGLTQRRVTDFNTSGNQTITLSDSPQAGDSIRINYTRS
jgi:hypothetical protein